MRSPLARPCNLLAASLLHGCRLPSLAAKVRQASATIEETLANVQSPGATVGTQARNRTFGTDWDTLRFFRVFEGPAYLNEGEDPADGWRGRSIMPWLFTSADRVGSGTLLRVMEDTG